MKHGMGRPPYGLLRNDRFGYGWRQKETLGEVSEL